ncbi:uncharacterized protein LOC110456400 isoform X2 [Mizuhopecten yessoensis]|uniref:uncharacterized protein LOC110456400 isoform X2 n=1 Tax=Mizuhopecten yessoensis TaxID=6573 RepID=UPI000B457EA0|nr:uncharacterized protein LOC110456400 isoform X2 [Mizuhopecten yessoensis]
MSVASFRRSQGFRNPDEDFVLHGRPSSFWEKPAYLNNSQITNSSIRLTSKHTMFNPEKYSDRHYVKSLGDIANNLGNLSANLNRSVSFSNKLQSKGISNNSASKFIDTEEELSRLRSQTSDLSFRGHPLRENENDWLNTANTMMSQRIASNYKTSYPYEGASSKVITSPYQSEIAKLRMERLRIEEDRLLELKRHEEIERIRGPNHRWYESKGPDFHYECSKNTEMMKHEDHWEELVDYRNSLMECSTAFRKSYGAFA